MPIRRSTPWLLAGSASRSEDVEITREEVQEMIDAAIRRHNRNAGIISTIVGWTVLAFYADGLFRLVG